MSFELILPVGPFEPDPYSSRKSLRTKDFLHAQPDHGGWIISYKGEHLGSVKKYKSGWKISSMHWEKSGRGHDVMVRATELLDEYSKPLKGIVSEDSSQTDETDRIQADIRSAASTSQLAKGVRPITGKLTDSQARILAHYNGYELPFVSVAPIYGFGYDAPKTRDHKTLLGLILGGKMRVLQVRGPIPGNHHYRLVSA